jgi:hypothetical protein
VVFVLPRSLYVYIQFHRHEMITSSVSVICSWVCIRPILLNERTTSRYTRMKMLIMDTVHSLLNQSGQSTPAKHISIGKNSLQIYDIEHWYENFNSLLLHDFPTLQISIDSSSASLSGFVITIHWTPPLDATRWIGILVHILVMCLGLFVVLSYCTSAIQNIPHDELSKIWDVYRGIAHDGPYAPTSLLADELRSVMV